MNTIKEITSYETICIVKPDLNEDNIAKIIETYQLMLVEKGAQNIVTQNILALIQCGGIILNYETFKDRNLPDLHMHYNNFKFYAEPKKFKRTN